MKNITPQPGRFLDPLVLKEVGPYRWEVIHDYRYVTNDGYVITVPRGFITNLYSVPKMFRGFVGNTLSSNGPAVVHDYAFAAQIWTDRKYADALMDEMLDNAPNSPTFFEKLMIEIFLKAGSAPFFNKSKEIHLKRKDFLERSLTQRDIVELSKER